MGDGLAVSAQDFVAEFERRVVEARARLSATDTRLIDHIRQHAEELPFETLDSLGPRAGASRAAVVRLAQRLGYDGFSEMRSAARRDLRQARSPLTRFRHTQGATPFAQLAHSGQANLQLTLSTSARELQQATALVVRAKSVYAAGNGISYPIALYLQQLLQRVRPHVHVIHPWARETAGEMTTSDVLIACLFSRYSKDTIKLLDYAAQRELPVVAITDGLGHSFLDRVRVTLVAHTDSPTLYPTMVGAVALVEGLAAEVSAADPEVSRRTLEAAEELLRVQRHLAG